MPRQRSSPSLYLKVNANGSKRWYARINGKRVATRFVEQDLKAAQDFLADKIRDPQVVKYEHLHSRLASAKQRAQRKGLPFDLTVRDVWNLGVSQGWRCALSGLPFEVWQGSRFSSPRTLSIDRIDPSQGYVKGNVRLVLVALNFAIGRWGEDAFAPIAEAFIQHRGSGLGRRDTEKAPRG